MKDKVINFGIIGLGNIGTGVVRNFLRHKDIIESRAGIRLNLKKIADIDLRNRAQLPLDDSFFTASAADIIDDPGIPVVIELIGGVGVAKDCVLKAIHAKKKVITANKALIAECGSEIAQALKDNPGSELFFEASVGGGIPVIKALREGYIGNEIRSITAIINGTSNYILSEMEKSGVSFDKALASAKKKGFAEADPTLDVEGIDSAHKIAILASIAYGSWIDYKKIHTEGITRITSQDFEYARRLGYKIKLLAIARRGESGLEVRVNPALLDFHHPLSAVDGSYNGVYIDAFPVGKNMFYGKGAGDDPTSSAVISDIVDAAKALCYEEETPSPAFRETGNGPAIADKMSWKSRYYMRIQAQDKPGVLAGIAGILGNHGISLSSVLQYEENAGRTVPVIMMTHMAKEKNMLAACEDIEKHDCIQGRIVIIRVLTENS